MYEICICSAVKTTDGIIIRGHRHRDCIEGIIRRGKKPAKDFNAQGFITSQNRFVDREEGFRLQKLAGIKSANPEGYNSAGWLYSEDLY
jgi:hypothetical protein